MMWLLGLFFLLVNVPNQALAMPEHSLKKLTMLHYDEEKLPAPIKKEEQGHSLDKYILILFFSNQCPHCVNFAPVVKHVAEENHFAIEPISLNGQTLPEFPNAQFATQEMIDLAYQGKPVVYPALFLANTQKLTLYPISFGEMSYEELTKRMNLLQERVASYEEHP